ncbi:family 16 glycoside hydrolase [Singulisphaera sp. Ch08]|uniref:Family 16 glycoside hydrolase n=1 Tax=Singulisphaera sp. Ch08 TaxID=3120278 RepID=A0AAU7CK93_9BACT
MSETRACAECGTSVPPGVSSGLCPSCLKGTEDFATATHRPEAKPSGGGGESAVGLDEFLRTLREMNFVADSDMDRLAEGAIGDVARLARVLVQTGHLTAYQAGALLQGKAPGLLIGQYLVLDKLGVGGMGVVFKARHRPSERVVALKMLPPSFGRNPEAVQRFRREFELASRLSHPNLVAAIEASEDRGVHFLTMDYIKGYDLERLVNVGGPLSIKLALHCSIQAARGLEAAHAQGVIHRDVKPGNVMIDSAGGVRVLDLGLARVIEATSSFSGPGGGSLTQTGAFMGSTDFLAPEQADDAKRADQRADIYSIGCTLYFLLTGQPPFGGDTVLKRLMAHQERPAPSLRAVRPEVSEAIEAIYLRMMAKRPADRPQSVTEVILALEACRSAVREAGDASADLKTFAVTVMKRAAPRGRRGPEASIFARPKPTGFPEFNPDLNLEDLITDYREEIRREPLPEHKLPPMLPRLAPPRRRRRRSSGPLVLILATVLGAVAAYLLFPSPRPAPHSTEPVLTRSQPNTIPPPNSGPMVGFIPLFNGKDLSGWAGDVESFEVHDGHLRARTATESTIYYPKPFSDFVARVEFHLSPGGNGGLAIRYPGKGNASSEGMCEIEIIDEAAFPNLDPRQVSGSAYGMVGAMPGYVRRAGEWNILEVTVRGSTVKVVLNGSIVLDDDLDYVDEFMMKAAHPGKNRSRGYFGLTNVNLPVEYRAVEIRGLDPATQTRAAEPVARAVPGPPSGRLQFFDDFSDRSKGWPAESDSELAKMSHHHWGYAEGVYRLDANVPGAFSWTNGLDVEDFYVEAVGRVFGDQPASRGAILLEVVKDEIKRGFQVRLTDQGEVFLEPSFRTVDEQPNGPRIGPVRHPAIRTGRKDAFNLIGVRLVARRVEVFVNRVRVIGPVLLDWDPAFSRILLGVTAEVPNIRAEFDRFDLWAASIRGDSLGTTPTDSAGRKLNLDFETGTLQDWTAEGEAFSGQPVEGDTVQARRNDMWSVHQGKFWVGTYERGGDDPQGTLTSAAFRVAQPFASLLIGGGAKESTCVEIVRNDSGQVIERFRGRRTEELLPVTVDLSPHVGQETGPARILRRLGSL